MAEEGLLDKTLPAKPVEVDPVADAGPVTNAELPVPETDPLATALLADERLAKGLPEEVLPVRPADVDPVPEAGLVTDADLPDTAVLLVDPAERPAVTLTALDEEAGGPITRVIVVV